MKIMNNNDSRLKKLRKLWLSSWKNIPDDAVAIAKFVARTGRVGLGSRLFSFLNSALSSGTMGISMLFMLLTTTLATGSIILGTSPGVDSPAGMDLIPGQPPAITDLLTVFIEPDSYISHQPTIPDLTSTPQETLPPPAPTPAPQETLPPPATSPPPDPTPAPQETLPPPVTPVPSPEPTVMLTPSPTPALTPAPTPSPTPALTPSPTPEPLPKQDQNALTIINPGAKSFGDALFILSTAGGSGTGEVTFVSSNEKVISIAINTGMVAIEGVGTATITATKAGDDNYHESTAAFTITIGTRSIENVTVNIISNNIYDGTQQSPDFIVTDGSENLITTSDYTVSYAGDRVNAGSFNMILTGLSNYHGTKTLSVPINPRGLIIAFTAENKIYDGTRTATITGRSIASGLIIGDDVTLSGGTAVFTDKNASTDKTVTASGFMLGGDDVSNYTIGTVNTATADITAKPITVTGITAQNRVYDSTTIVLLSSGTLQDTVVGDNIGFALHGGTITDANALDDKPVTPNAVTLTGSDSGNYLLTQPGYAITVNITPRPITINPNTGQSKVFGTTDPTFTFSAVPALLGNDTFTGSLERTAGEGIGAYPFNLGSLSAGSNYILTFSGSVNFAVTLAPGVFGTPDAINTTYTPGLTLSDLNTFLPSGYAWVDAAATPLSGGNNQSFAAIYTNPDGNHSPANGYITVNVARAEQQALIIDNPGTKTYGDSGFTITTTGGTTGGTVTFERISGSSLNIGSSGFTLIENAGETVVRATMAGNTNYNPVVSEPFTITIAKRPLADSMIGSITGFTYTGQPHTPFPNNVTDLISSVNLIKAGDWEVDTDWETDGYKDNINAGEATIRIRATTSGNYAGTAEGKFNISKATLTVTADDKDKELSGTTPLFTYTITGFVLGEDETVVSGEPVLTTDYNQDDPRGNYDINITAGNLAADNYNFTFVGGTLTVGVAPQTPLTLETNDSEVSYVYGATGVSVIVGGGSTGGEVTFSVTDSVPVNAGGSVFEVDSSGNVTILGAGVATIRARMAGNDDFRPVYQDLVITITPKPLASAVISINSVTYTGTAHTPSITVTDGAALERNIDYSWTFTPQTNANEAGYDVVINGIGNYSGSVTASFIINRALLTITADDKEIVFNSAAPVFTVSYSGLVGTDTPTVNGLGGLLTFDTDYVTGNNIGTYDIEPSGLTSPNYNITFVNGELTVIKATGSFGNPAAIDTTYTTTLTLSDLNSELPSGYAWGSPLTPLSAGNGQTFDATFTDPSGNFEPVSGYITVNVAKAAGNTATDAITVTYSPTLTVADAASSHITNGYSFADAGVSLTVAGSPRIVTGYKDNADPLNFEQDSITVTITVNPLSIGAATLTIDGTTFTYNGSPHTPLVFVTIGGGAELTSADFDVDYSSNTEAGTATITVTGKGNYTGTATDTFQIDKANQTAITAITGITEPVTYGDIFTLGITGGTGTGAVTYQVTSGNATITEGNLLTITGTGSITITAVKAGDTNYNNSNTATRTISAGTRTLTITGVAATPRNYNGLDTVVLTGGALQNTVTSDTVGFTLGTGTMADADVGTAKPVTTAITLTNNAAGNYTLTQPTGVTANITALSVTDAIVGTFDTITYTGSAQTPVATVTINGLTASGTWSNVTTVGQPTTFTATGNFTGTIANQNPNMNRATPTVATNPTASAINAGQALSTSALSGGVVNGVTGENNLAGTWAWVTGTTTVNSTGTFAATFTPSSANYNTVTENINVTVNPPGSEGNPFLVTNLADLLQVGRGNTHTGGTWALSSHYLLTDNITLTTDWVPVGDLLDGFAGTFNGDGHTITGLTINDPTGSHVALFGYITSSGAVRNLGLVGANITGGSAVGGIAGESSGMIENCYVTGSITGLGSLGKVGGVVGENWDGTVQNCYSTATISGTDSVGGIVGSSLGGTVQRNAALNQSITGTIRFGRVVGDYDSGFFAGTLAVNYAWNNMRVNGSIVTTGLGPATIQGANAPAGTASNQINNQDTWITILGFRFTDSATPGPWKWGGDPALPYMGNTPTAMPFNPGTVQNPFTITTEAQLRQVGRGDAGYEGGTWTRMAHYKLEGNINLTPGNWTPIATNTAPFLGSFDGGGHTITGMTITGTGELGMFSATGPESVVQNLSLAGVNVTGTTGDRVGGLTGLNQGIIRNVSVSGTVSSTSGNQVGGIAGGNAFRATIENSYSTATVSSGGQRVGGIAGDSTATGDVTIRNTVALGSSVTGSGMVGRVSGSQVASNPSGVSEWTNNRAFTGMGGSTAQFTAKTLTGKDGADVTVAALQTQASWNDANFNFNDIWVWQDGFMPRLWNSPAQPWPAHFQPGSEANPFIITTEAQLRQVGDGVNGRTLSAHYRLGANITLTGNWTPIGNTSTQFTGVFDGNGHTISNLTINSTTTDNAGMFGSLTGTVKDLGLVNVSITAVNDSFCGGIAGMVGSEGLITNSFVTGTISGDSSVGGIAGNVTMGTVRNSWSTANVTATGNNDYERPAGGIAGTVMLGFVENCFATGIVRGNSGVGGIAGMVSFGGSIRNSVAINPSIERTNGTRTGFGRVAGTLEMAAAINNHAFNTMAVLGAVPTTNIGAAAINGATITAANINDISWWRDTAFRVGQANGMTVADWDNFMSHHVPPPSYGALGTEYNPFLIHTEADLRAVGGGTYSGNNWSLTAHYRLMANIDLTGRPNWTPIGVFAGTFDGNGHTITGMTIIGADNMGTGMFRGISGVVRNLGLINVNITGTASAVGGITGENAGIIERCFVIGSINGANIVGGIVGINNSTIRNVYSFANVTATGVQAGGIAGNMQSNSATIYYSYSTGQVSGTGQVGGIAGDRITGLVDVYSTVALNTALVRPSGTATTFGRITGGVSNINRNQNYGRSGMALPVTPTSVISGQHGLDITATQWNSAAWWTTAGNWTDLAWNGGAGWNTSVWDIADGRLPILRGFAPGTQNPIAPTSLELPAADVTLIAEEGGLVSFDGETWHTEITEPVVIGFLPVTVSAMPDEDWEFKHWLDEYNQIVNTDIEYTFTVQEELKLTAVFESLADDIDEEDETDGDDPTNDDPTNGNEPIDNNNPTDSNESTDGTNNDPTNNGNDPESKPDEKSGSEEPNADADISALADELEENGFAANLSGERNITPLRAGAYSHTEENTPKNNNSFIDLWQLLPFLTVASIVVYILKIKKRQR